MKHVLSIDYETFSDEPIKKAGLYRYIQSPVFEPLLCGYSINGGPTLTLDLVTDADHRRFFRSDFARMLFSPEYEKHAWNAAFEIMASATCFNLPPENLRWFAEQWRDTMLHARYCGLPGSLDGCGKALGLPEDKKKQAAGKALIRTFSVPRTPTARDPRARVRPEDEPEKWNLFKEYNIQDVVTESYIENLLAPWPVPEFLQRQWVLDLVQNARGVGVDMTLVSGALRCAGDTNAALTAEAKELTGLENPNSTAQLLGWIKANYGEDALSTMDKTAVAELMERVNEDDE